MGAATDCEHADTTTGDVQQDTSGGLLYLRKDTTTLMFADGAERWALRSRQLLKWTSVEVDPPQSALVTATSAPTQPAATRVPNGRIHPAHSR